MNKQLILPRSIRRAYTEDGLMTYDAQTIDSTGAFLVGELERLDQTLHMPLASVSYRRDLLLRTDVSIADEFSSYTNSSFAAPGGTSPNGKAWVGKESNVLQNIQLDIGKTVNPLTLWAMELGWTVPELESSIKLGRPVDDQKFRGMSLKYEMDCDEQAYIGDTGLGVYGLCNNTSITPTSTVNGNWIAAPATADQVLADINDILEAGYAASGYAVCPDSLLLPPPQWSYLVETKVSSAGNESILSYVERNSICNKLNGRPLNINPLKWLVNRGASNAQRMVAYNNSYEYVRFPIVPLQRVPLQYRGISQIVPYFGRIGVVEIVYPETVVYRDGI